MTTQPPCPYCRHEHALRPSGASPALKDDVLFRRHRCGGCGRTFTTVQVALTPALAEKLEATFD